MNFIIYDRIRAQEKTQKRRPDPVILRWNNKWQIFRLDTRTPACLSPSHLAVVPSASIAFFVSVSITFLKSSEILYSRNNRLSSSMSDGGRAYTVEMYFKAPRIIACSF